MKEKNREGGGSKEDGKKGGIKRGWTGKSREDVSRKYLLGNYIKKVIYKT